MKRGRLQCKDISTLRFLGEVAQINDTGRSTVPHYYFDGPESDRWFPDRGTRWAQVMDLEAFFDAPNALIRAKVRQLEARGLITGCGCGCRGDIEIMDAGRDMLTRDEVLA